MFDMIGFLFLVGLNFIFSLLCLVNIRYGGGDLGNLFTGWVDWKIKMFGVILVVINIYFWYLLITSSPFTIIVE